MRFSARVPTDKWAFFFAKCAKPVERKSLSPRGFGLTTKMRIESQRTVRASLGPLKWPETHSSARPAKAIEAMAEFHAAVIGYHRVRRRRRAAP